MRRSESKRRRRPNGATWIGRTVRVAWSTRHTLRDYDPTSQEYTTINAHNGSRGTINYSTLARAIRDGIARFEENNGNA